MGSEYVVIVGRQPEQCEPLSRALANHGWTVLTCAGPATSGCPLLSGDDCTLRDAAAAAVTYMDARKAPTANIPLVRCAAASSAPSVVVLEGQVDPPRLDGSFAIVGALRGPEAISSALHDLLQAVPESPSG